MADNKDMVPSVSSDVAPLRGLEEAPERLVLLGNEDYFATVRWTPVPGLPPMPIEPGLETLLAFADETLAHRIMQEHPTMYAGLEPLSMAFERAREVALDEDLDALAIVVAPEDVRFHYVR